jgi:hypothetical protein
MYIAVYCVGDNRLVVSRLSGNPGRMTDFEAFGEDDLHGESSSTETG